MQGDIYIVLEHCGDIGSSEQHTGYVVYAKSAPGQQIDLGSWSGSHGPPSGSCRVMYFVEPVSESNFEQNYFWYANRLRNIDSDYRYMEVYLLKDTTEWRYDRGF